MPFQPGTIAHITEAAVTVDLDKCIADKGCTVCIDVCPMDILALDPATGKAHMKHDECWYCLPCQKDCPTQAIKVSIPYLVR
jgi:NAD-dependent dihydropyrimidine dehydrogenase PreA subunit